MRSGLPAYVDDGCIKIDNNAAERAIRKNWLFVGSDQGGCSRR